MPLSTHPVIIRIFTILLLICLHIGNCYAQDGVLIDYVGSTRDNSAVLDVRSTNQGFLAPRVLLTATNVAAPITSPANGLMVYNTNATGSGPTDVQPGYYYWNGTAWTRFQSGSSAPVLGSGAATRVAFWDAANSLSSDADLYWDNSVNKRLGVGTASPGRKLDVNGESRFRNTMYFGATDNEGLISWTNDMGNGEDGLVIRGQSGRGILLGSNAGSHVMIDNAGSVGIGTTGGPGQKLDVAGGSIRTTHQLMSTIATGTSPLQVASTTLNTNLNSDLLDGWHAHELQFQQSSRDFPNGTLIQTDINYAVANGEPWLLEIEGNSYGNLVPLDLKVQGYIYYDSLINVGGISNGHGITGLSAFNYGGNLCFWFPYQAYWQGYSIYVNDSYAGIKNNRLVSITHQAKPGGITKEVQLTPKIRQSWHSGNFTPSSYAPITGGTGYIQNQVAADQAAGFRINGNGLFNGGSVGIGNPSPSTKLHINLGAGGVNSTPALRIDGLSNYPSLELGIKGNYDGVIRTYGNDLHLYAGHWRTSGTNATEDHNLAFYTSQTGNTNWETPKMYLRYDGRLGVGTTSPESHVQIQGGDLTVSGQGRFKGWYTQGTGLAAEIGVSGSQAYVYSYNRTSSSYQPINLSGSTVGIGHSGQIDDVYIDGAGLVGINTTGPTQQLDVNGQVRIRGGSPAADKVLTATDANGNAVWQTPTSHTSATAAAGGTGWRRIAHVDGSAGRGHGKVTVYTTGGSYAPRMTTINWNHDWSTEAGLTVTSESGAASYWSDVRITDDGTNSFIEVNFTTNVADISLLSDNYGYRPAVLYSGTLPAGGGSVRATSKVGRFNAGEDRLFVNFNGNVGLSTGTPVSNLEIEGGAANWNETTPGLAVGSIHLDPGTTSANIGNAITWGAHDTGAGDNGQAGIYVRSNSSYGTKMYFGTTDSYATGSKTRMMIDALGKVGIGTTSPTRQLDIYGAASTYPARVGSPDGYLDFGPANTGFSHFSTDRPIFYFNTAVQVDGGLIGSYNQDLQLRTGTTTRITALHSNGNVGIGTPTPGQKLEVAGNIKLDDNMMVEGNSTYRVYRNLATYNSSSSAATGAFVINTNQPWNGAHMFRLKVEGYFYDSTAPFEMTIGGYMYVNNDFYNYGYVNVGAKKLSVRFARNTSTDKLAIIIGDEGGSYSYPKLTVTSYMQGHSSPNEAHADGWSISQITSLGGYGYVTSVPDVTNAGQGASIYSNETEIALSSNNTGSYSNSTGAGWTPGTWQDVSSFSVTRTITNGNMVSITAEGLVETDNYNYYTPSCVYFRLVRGSTEIARTAVFASTLVGYSSSFWLFNSGSFSMNVVETATSGSQTYKVQYWMPNEFGSTETVRIGSRRLNVLEMNQQ